MSNNKNTIHSEDNHFDVELHNALIEWDLKRGNLSFFGIDSAMFWTDPSLFHMLSPLAEEIGNDLFRLLIAYSSSLGTKEDYQNMVSTLGDNFETGFLAWGRAVSTAGWGIFEMPEFNISEKSATVIVRNSWELSAQRNLSPDKRWGAPFIQGKLIGIFRYVFSSYCWADDNCYFDSKDPYVELKIYATDKNLKDELKQLRYERMVTKEKILADKINQKTAELQNAKNEIENHSRLLEKKVAERTAELIEINKKLQEEIDIRKEAEIRKESLIAELYTTIKEVKTLRGLLPICSSCKKVRDDDGYWRQIESYISDHSEAQFSHGCCPECAKKLYPDFFK